MALEKSGFLPFSISTLNYENHGVEEELATKTKVLYAATAAGLVVLAGIASGLTLGLLSLDAIDLEVLRRSGTERERKLAGRIIPLVKNQHLLLTTLLITNAACAESIPIFIDRLANPVVAVLLSLTLLLLVGEIIPQALCKQYGLAVGAYLSWFVRILIFLLYPVAYPISKLLDCIIGHDQGVLFRRAQLRSLVELYWNMENYGGDLTMDEINVIVGALELNNKTAAECMTPMDKVFMVDVDRPLDDDFYEEVLESGHSRVPVYQGSTSNVVGCIITKELLRYRKADNLTVADVERRPLPRLPTHMAMFDILRMFETGRSHLALLVDTKEARQGQKRTTLRDVEAANKQRPERFESPRPGAPDDSLKLSYEELQKAPVAGIITIEDVIEELIRTEIVDETDRFVDNLQSLPVKDIALLERLPSKLRRLYLGPGGPLGTPMNSVGHDSGYTRSRRNFFRSQSTPGADVIEGTGGAATASEGHIPASAAQWSGVNTPNQSEGTSTNDGRGRRQVEPERSRLLDDVEGADADLDSVQVEREPMLSRFGGGNGRSQRRL